MRFKSGRGESPRSVATKNHRFPLRLTASAVALSMFTGAASAAVIGVSSLSSHAQVRAAQLVSAGNEIPAEELTETGSADEDAIATEEDVAIERDFYILLLGVDASDERRDGAERKAFVEEQGGDFRADSITLAHVNLDTSHITLMSFDRDLKSIVSGYEDDGYHKLNESYEIGGVPAVKTEIEELSGVDIPYYAVVDMTALETLVDSLGGIDVDIEEAFWDEQLEDGFSKAGVQHLDGYHALLYSRARHAFADGTISRARHQRQVIQAIGSKLKESDLVGLYSSLVGVAGQMATNLDFPQLYDLGQALRGIDWDENVHMLQSPTVGCLDGERWYSFIVRDDWKKAVAQLRANDGKKASDKQAAKVKLKTNAVFADETVYFSGYTTSDA